MAYNAGKLVSGIRVYSSRREPQGECADDFEPSGGLGTHRSLAWRRLEFCPLGYDLFPAYFPGKEDVREMAGEQQGAGPYLFDSVDSGNVGSVCHYGYGTAGRVSGQYDRLSQGGDSGRHDTACQIFEGIRRANNSVRYFCDSSSRKIVLEMEGPLVHGSPFAYRLLVVGSRDHFGKQ